MTMLERMDADMGRIFADGTSFGEDVLFVPAGDAALAVPLRGIFDLTGTDVNPGSRQPAVMRRPMLTMLESAVRAQTGRLPARADRVRVRERDYRVETVEPDGCGMVVLKLLEADSE